MKKILFFLLILHFNTKIFAGNTPGRIISLAPAITEELYLLGVQDNLLGVTTYCDYPEEAKKKEKIGTYLEPNIEKIVRLKPDIILASKEGQKKEIVLRMKSYGLKVYALEPCNNFKEISEQFLLLGKLLGKEKKAIDILSALNERTTRLTNKTKKSVKVKVFWQLGAEPLMTISKNTFIDEMITLAGGQNIAHEGPLRYPRFNKEEVLRQNPDVIILVAMGAVTETEKKQWQKYSDLKAVKNSRIFVIDTRITCNPTPVNFVEAIEIVSKLLHPELFK